MASQVANNTSTSSLIYGCMGLGGGWDSAPISKEQIQQTHTVIDAALESGITLFDHADIYTLGKAEQVFGTALKERPCLADIIRLQSKCAIRFADQNGPARYDFSKSYLLDAVDHILSRLGVEQLDTLLLHRPDPLMVPEEVAEAVQALQQAGKIRQLGVSNMNGHQMALLQSALNTPIVCNQIEMSLTKLDWLEQSIGTGVSSSLGTIEYCRMHDVSIQAWGSLSQGILTGKDTSSQSQDIQDTAHRVTQLSEKYSVSKEAIVLAWLMRHPANINPVIGTTNPARIAACAQAKDIELSRADWYLLFESARGQQVP
ncbi:aldo/keto reductase [Vibrio methylphosphonaticus]|uniref:aldo/keto reductase n=1 Tax=Vibrio methylphosphonaticus TaxID=2946866 RepID=UPI002029B877|nr:aldo/keto reductase [Vibrio methylphosphonaticus]MCL9776215.1 aldo/keto reductase [Vibrio methylphosphonaticus]